MTVIEYLFWAALFFGCINLQPKNSLVIVSSLFCAGLLLVMNIVDVEGFAKYIARLAALCIFGAVAIKSNIFGLMLLFLCLLISSMLMILNKHHYLIYIIILFIPIALIILKKMRKVVDIENIFDKWIVLIECKITNTFMPLLGVAVVFPFGLLIAKVPLN
jgi:hypothetical protein